MRLRIAILYVCFLLSGFSALVYEIVWQRMLTLVFGVSTWSISAVLTALMAGLGLGALAFGRIADRFSHPGRWYAGVELAIAAAGLAVSLAIDPLMSAYVKIATQLGAGSYLSHLIRFGLALLVLIVPCTLIGGTAPLMGRLVARWSSSLGVGFSRFYAVNTAGALLGTGMAGFFLIQHLGMQKSVWVAVGGNVLAALLAVLVGWRDLPGRAALTTPSPPPDLADDRARPRPDLTRFALIIACLSGLTGLGYEVAWARILAVFTLNSVYVFTMLLTVYLAGLAVGGGAAAWVLRRTRGASLTVIGVLQLLLALTAPLVLGLTRYAGEWGLQLQVRDPQGVFLHEYLLTLAIVFVPTVMMGMTLPLLADLVRGGALSPGRAVGWVYASNSLGTVAGAALTGVLLIPMLGIRTTILALGLVNFCVGCAAALRDEERAAASPFRKWLIPVASAVFVGVSTLTPFGAHFIRPDVVEDKALLYYAEGSSAVVHISQAESERREYRTLYVDSQSVAGTTDKLITDQKMLAHLPLLIAPEPKRALTVGFGTGGTSYSMLLHKIETHCVEIEPMVPAGARFFFAQNHGRVGLGPRTQMGSTDYRLIIDDARSWLHLADVKYDVIVNDLTSLQYRGNGNLYTVECFELIKACLTPTGLGCAWVPITGVDPEPLKMIFRTFKAVFPHTSVWYMNNEVNDFVILVGSPQPVSISLDEWRFRMSEPLVEEDLAEVGLTSVQRLASSLLLVGDEVDCFAGTGPLHTDDQPLLDYRTHAGAYHDTLSENLRALLACSRAGREGGVLAESTSDAERAEFDRWLGAARLINEGHAYQREWNRDKATEAYVKASQMIPEDASVARLAGIGD